MALTIHESFSVGVPPERAWEFLLDPVQVVQCLPGAELTETVDDQTYRGRVRVKVGPVTTAYDGTATLTEVSDSGRRMRMVGQGREVGAAGSAMMTMTCRVSACADGGSQVEVDATIDIAGRIMQFGRGLVESVSRQLFKQFAEAVQRALEGTEASQPAAALNTHSPRPRELSMLPILWRALRDSARRLFRRA